MKKNVRRMPFDTVPKSAPGLSSSFSFSFSSSSFSKAESKIEDEDEDEDEEEEDGWHRPPTCVKLRPDAAGAS